ncbi:hypothetical protein FAZ69_24120 [Trinickia terrae]|uniref:DUF1571 domain-containing protein n=2 Tax=Trinickia terrae TaxID=2571161 RepID=A0A4U1HQE3_9BURK|nr:hypothetical protein FAZ69_24120 [Trinickia terrae]
MKTASTLAAALAAMSINAAAQSYDSYDAFYAAQPDTVFGVPIKQDIDPNEPTAHVLHSYPDKPGYFTELHAKLEQKALTIELWQNRIVVDGKTYRFARATAFPGEHASNIFPESAEVFVAARANIHPPLVCVEGHGSASGEASSRYQQIFLVMNPLARRPVFLQLPGLLSSCRAVLVTKDGKLAFPKNSYLFDATQESRVGLLMSYYTFENQRFVPALYEIRLRFTRPEVPFQFSVQDKNETASAFAPQMKKAPRG